jgi:hAT family C-terminal dimerisation region
VRKLSLKWLAPPKSKANTKTLWNQSLPEAIRLIPVVEDEEPNDSTLPEEFTKWILQTSHLDITGKYSNACEFWKHNDSGLETWALIAYDYQSIPASSAEIERIFSRYPQSKMSLIDKVRDIHWTIEGAARSLTRWKNWNASDIG